MISIKKKGYFAFIILFGILVTLIYFLFSLRTNNDRSELIEKDLHQYNYKIIFINKYNLPLINSKVIPPAFNFSAEMVGWTIETILLHYRFNFSVFAPINKNTLQKKYHQITTIGLIPKPQYIKWYSRQLVTPQLLNQVLVPSFFQTEVIRIMQDKINSSEIISIKLRQYLSGNYLKYFNIIRFFCVF